MTNLYVLCSTKLVDGGITNKHLLINLAQLHQWNQSLIKDELVSGYRFSRIEALNLAMKMVAVCPLSQSHIIELDQPVVIVGVDQPVVYERDSLHRFWMNQRQQGVQTTEPSSRTQLASTDTKAAF